MSMSTHVVGFHPPDETWKKMKAVHDACMAARIPVPVEVEEFFDGSSPDEAGVEVNLKRLPCTKVYSVDASQGFEISIADLPPSVTTIRFYNSW